MKYKPNQEGTPAGFVKTPLKQKKKQDLTGTTKDKFDKPW